ncbi:hypothetical protein BY996DRAFT_6474228 [Phakopsora pachyrhizi]|nr:hypothetical protein BY996DRAFT_6474228 [Phakopsora pachyrhizi]
MVKGLTNGLRDSEGNDKIREMLERGESGWGGNRVSRGRSRETDDRDSRDWLVLVRRFRLSESEEDKIEEIKIPVD